MASGAAIGPHNAFKGPVDTDPSIDAACSSTADVSSSCFGDSSAGTDVLLLITLKLRWMYLQTWVKRKLVQAWSWSHKQTSDLLNYESVNIL